MGRVLKILSLAVLIFLGYMGITLMTKSCNNEKSNSQEITNQNQDKKKDIFEDEEFFAEGDSTDVDNTINYKELDQTIADAKEEEKNQSTQPEATPMTLPSTSSKDKTTQASPAKPISNTVAKNATQTKQDKPAAIDKPKEVKATPTQTQESLSGNGSFTVVAGNYLLEANADQMVKKLKNSGFNSAEKVIFDLSEFFTVIAGRYSSYDSAAKAVSNLKAKGIDCYIHRKK